MTTSTIATSGQYERSGLTRRGNRVHLGRSGLAFAGIIAVLVSAWGGIVPYVGPLFGYSGDGSASWTWNLAHGVLGLVPGVVGVLLGLFVLGEARGVTIGRGRLSLATAGTLLMAVGAWFAIGPLAWPVLSNGSAYFVTNGSHLRLLANEVGYSIGTGLILVICGAFVDGWASRHQPRATVVTDAPSTIAPAAAAPAEPAAAAPAPAQAAAVEPTAAPAPAPTASAPETTSAPASAETTGPPVAPPPPDSASQQEQVESGI